MIVYIIWRTLPRHIVNKNDTSSLCPQHVQPTYPSNVTKEFHQLSNTTIKYTNPSPLTVSFDIGMSGNILIILNTFSMCHWARHILFNMISLYCIPVKLLVSVAVRIVTDSNVSKVDRNLGISARSFECNGLFCLIESIMWFVASIIDVTWKLSIWCKQIADVYKMV